MSVFRLFSKSRHREWRKPGHETHEILLSANDPNAQEFAAALRKVNVDVCVVPAGAGALVFLIAFGYFRV